MSYIQYYVECNVKLKFDVNFDRISGKKGLFSTFLSCMFIVRELNFTWGFPLFIGMGVPFWMCRSYFFSHRAEGHNFFISQGGHHLNLGIKGSKVSRDIH